MKRLAYLAAACALAAIAFAVPSVAFAGCTDYTAKIATAPAVNVCVGAMCQETMIAVTCANATTAITRYGNGLTLIEKPGIKTAELSGSFISPGILTCSIPAGAPINCFATP